MKKIFLISFYALLLAACSEKKAYEQALLEKMQKEQDVKDYRIEPEKMADCVFNTTSQRMPGFSSYDPYRRAAYDKFAKMLTVTQSDDPKKAFEDLKKLFGDPKKMAEAHSMYTESMMECYSLLTDTRSDEENIAPATPEKNVSAPTAQTPTSAPVAPSAPEASVPAPAQDSKAAPKP